MKICKWCEESIMYVEGYGWVHMDGSVYKTRKRTEEEIEHFKEIFKREPYSDELYVDDHCVLPVDK